MTIGPEPSATSDDEEELPTPRDEVRRLFWAIVLLLNLGFLAVSLGIMLAGFRGQYRDGALLVGGGSIVLYGAYRRYQSRHEILDVSE
ncbi:MAG: DUF7322 domain-containing protein [archaeon]